MKNYHIHREGEENGLGEVTVTVTKLPVNTENGLDFAGTGHYKLPLKPSLKLYNHSPTGFNFGYGGSGPAQLALAILLDYTGDKMVAGAFHQDFKWKFIGGMQHPGGVIKGADISRWLTEHTPTSNLVISDSGE
jgi:hypothetical protein